MANSMEAPAPLGAQQAETPESKLVVQTIADMKLVAYDSKKQLTANLAKAEGDIAELQKLEGGTNTNFLNAVDKINNGLKHGEASANFLPGLNITGLSSEGHITVFDTMNTINATLEDKQGMVEVVAPNEKINDNLYLDSSHPVRDLVINPFAIKQGDLGDCTFLAALSSMAKVDPDRITRMIQDNGKQPDGTHTYTVTFPGDAGNPLTVNAPTKYEIHRFAEDVNGTWVSVLEKAYRKYTGKQLYDPGAEGTYAMRLLSGHEPDVVDFPAPVEDKDSNSTPTDPKVLDQIKQELVNDMQQGKLLTTGTRHDLPLPTGRDPSGDSVANLVHNHMYTVLNFNPETSMVTLRNPWDYNKTTSGGTQYGGVLRMELQDYIKDFGYLVTAQ